MKYVFSGLISNSNYMSISIKAMVVKLDQNKCKRAAIITDIALVTVDL